MEDRVAQEEEEETVEEQCSQEKKSERNEERDEEEDDNSDDDMEHDRSSDEKRDHETERVFDDIDLIFDLQDDGRGEEEEQEQEQRESNHKGNGRNDGDDTNDDTFRPVSFFPSWPVQRSQLHQKWSTLLNAARRRARSEMLLDGVFFGKVPACRGQPLKRPRSIPFLIARMRWAASRRESPSFWRSIKPISQRILQKKN